jgi:hypothetical protein
MPYVFGCPQCDSKLKTATPIPPERTIHCPKCKTSFTVADTHVEEVPSDSPLSPSHQSSSTDASNGDSRDDRSSTRRDPWDNRWDRDSNNDGERSPRGQRDGDDEGFERRRQKDNLDERVDDAPKRRTADEDHDPRDYRGHGRSKKSNKGLIFGLALLGLLLIGGIAWLAMREFGRDHSDTELLAHLPRNTTAVVGMDFEALWKQPDAKQALEQPEMQQAMQLLKDQFGVALTDIERIIVGVADIDERKSPKVVVIVRANGRLNRDKIVASFNGVAAEHNGTTYYTGMIGACYFPSRDTFVFASDKSVMTDEVMGSTGAIRYSSELQEMIKPIGNKQFWGAMVITPDVKKMIQISDANRKQAVAVLPKAGVLIDFLSSAKGAALYIHSEGPKSKLGLGLKFDDANKADQFASAAKETIQEGVNQLMNLIGFFAADDIINFAKATAKDTTVELEGNVGYAVITINNVESKRLLEKYKDQLQNMQGGNAPAFGRPPVKNRPVKIGR